jgi:hypothetical protein
VIELYYFQNWSHANLLPFVNQHLAVECYRIVYTSLHFQTLEEKSQWLGDRRQPTENLKDFAYAFQTLTGDGILVCIEHPSIVHKSDVFPMDSFIVVI